MTIFDKAYTKSEILSNEKFRIVAFGAEDGYILKKIQSEWPEKRDRIVYIGLEGRSKVTGSTEVSAQFLTNQQQMIDADIIGMDKEVLFQDAIISNHEVVSFMNRLKTIAHFYDGGLVHKDIMKQVIDIASHFASGSIMIFVTNQAKNIDKEDPRADRAFIKTNMTQAWSFIKHSLYIYESGAEGDPTMVALFFKKK